MIEIHPRLWLGDDDDAAVVMAGVRLPSRGSTQVATFMNDGLWACVSAAKEPYHRQLVGYAGRAAPDGPERYSVRRGRHLALNWVDVDDPEWFRDWELRAAAWHIDAAQQMDLDCLVHCNQGASRSPSLVLWWLHARVDDWRPLMFEQAEERLRSDYPAYDPTEGVREFVRRHW